jgi:chromatin remodeling complex protein RSC6
MSSSAAAATATSAAKAVKKVAKKEEAAPAAPVAVPAPVAAVAAAAEPKAKKAAKAAAPAAAAAPVAAVVSSTPVVQAAAAAAPAAPATSLDEDLKAVTTYLTTLRETVNNLLGQVKRLDKRVHREIKDARKRRRRVKVEEGVDAPKRAPSIFERPVQVTDELCTFLAQPSGTLMSRSQVTKGVNNYVKEKNLKNKHDIKPDAALKKLLSIDQEPLTYFNLQRYLNRHYVKAAAPVATA